MAHRAPAPRFLRRTVALVSGPQRTRELCVRIDPRIDARWLCAMFRHPTMDHGGYVFSYFTGTPAATRYHRRLRRYIDERFAARGTQ